MPRRVKCRQVGHIPREKCFKPASIPVCELEEVIIKIEEVEAIRLKDLLGLEQVECAESMGVSRTTFQRILTESRAKIADALINAKVLMLEGGDYELTNDDNTPHRHRHGNNKGFYRE